MVRFIDTKFDESNVDLDDFFICTIGFEERSAYLLNIFIDRLNVNNILVFCFKDLINKDRISKIVNSLVSLGVQVRYVNYEDADLVYNDICSFLLQNNRNKHRIYIDYSAMPRTWYSKLPVNLASEGLLIDYLYVKGDYEKDERDYPCAGIDSFSIIGTPSLRNSNRLHVIGIGYDSTRTTGLISILDPDAFCICSAHHSQDDEMEKKVQNANKAIVSQALFTTSLFIDDFSYMIAKLCELAYEYSGLGDVIFVPDGPKPLIMAMSLIPQIVDKEGVMCIHISRNINGYEFVNTKATDIVLSFRVE